MEYEEMKKKACRGIEIGRSRRVRVEDVYEDELVYLL